VGRNGQETDVIRVHWFIVNVGSERRLTFSGSSVVFRRKVELYEGQNQPLLASLYDLLTGRKC
jgi:hypothetical protein